MSLYEDIVKREAKIAITGMGYVGMPLAVAFAKKADVIGFDINERKIAQYIGGIDPTDEVGDEAVRRSNVLFTSDETMLQQARFHVVAVPTPINNDKTPDLTPVESASALVGRNLKAGSIVVFESTVYPGVTEDICVPILEKESSLVCGRDFKVGYSPERINPGDRVHRLQNIVKIVSGMDEETLETIASVYQLVVDAGVHRVSSIKVAEAAKVAENSQRDVNIAFVNELAMVLNMLSVDTNEVIDAMNTKWNALGFRPGLVGGHCIGVDPYYIVYEAERLGYHSQIVAAGRKINDGMGAFVADAAIKQMVLANKIVRSAKVVILGITFKENCPDVRNTKVLDIARRLGEYGIQPLFVDPWANPDEVRHEYGLELTPLNYIHGADCVILAVAHREFRALSMDELAGLYNGGEKVFIDVKGLIPTKVLEAGGYHWWRL